MAVLRAFVRRNLADPPLAVKLPRDHEMDWLATRSGAGSGDSILSLWNTPQRDKPEDQAAQAGRGWDLCEMGNQCKYAIDYRQKNQASRTVPTDAKQYTHNSGYSSDTKSMVGDLESPFNHVLRERKRLAKAAKWETPLVPVAIRLAKSIGTMLNSAMFSDYTGTGFNWSFGNALQFKAVREWRSGTWKADFEELEAALSLWLYSVRSKDGTLDSVSPSYSQECLRILGKRRYRGPLRRDLQW